ncbi:MAG: sigma-E processing peptidase SpoIIGA [Clostridiales bacterium]|nr:sigma-E processing peptidase SpoIIGA [Clostridiales bacterium]
MVEIYADVVFLINFVMDAFIFWIVGKLIKQKCSIFRLLFGGLVTSLLFCFLIFIPFLRPLYNLPILMAILALGVKITFDPKTIREFIKYTALFNIVSFCVGGMGIALFYYTNISNLIGNMVGFYIEGLSFKILISVSCMTYVLLKFAVGWYRKHVIKKQKFYNIKIFFDKYNEEIRALVDTGNQLSDPLTESPVIIAEFNSIKEFLPNELKVLFYENKENDLMALLNDTGQYFYKRIRLIPFNSIGKENGILLGFKPDRVEICVDEKNIVVENIIIGIYNFKLSNNNSYQGLLNPEVLYNIT